MTLGHRVAVLDHGRLQQSGRRASSTTGPANRFVAGFIGSPAMNLVRGRRSARTASVSFGRAGDVARLRRGRTDGRSAVVLGLRPEALELGD